MNDSVTGCLHILFCWYMLYLYALWFAAMDVNDKEQPYMEELVFFSLWILLLSFASIGQPIWNCKISITSTYDASRNGLPVSQIC